MHTKSKFIGRVLIIFITLGFPPMFLSLPLLQRPTSVQTLHCWDFTWCGSPCPLWGSSHLVSPQGRCRSGGGGPAGLLCYPAWPSPYLTEFHRLGNPGPETAVLFACKCDRWLSLQISLDNLNLDTTADSLGVLELDTNEVTTELPGGFREGREAGRLQLSSVSLHITPPAGHGSCA